MIWSTEYLAKQIICMLSQHNNHMFLQEVVRTQINIIGLVILEYIFV